jgi:hypothetical protein
VGRCRGYRSVPLHHEAILRALPSIVPLSHPSVMLRKSVVLEAGGYGFHDYMVAEDYELWSRLAGRGLRFANHPEALLRYRVHPGQMKCTHLRETIRAILHVKRHYWRHHMDRWARLRSWAEWSMLALPPGLVLRLFRLTQYHQRLPLPGGVDPIPGTREDGSHDAQVLHRRLPALRDDPAAAGVEPPPADCHRHGDEVLLLPARPVAAAAD